MFDSHIDLDRDFMDLYKDEIKQALGIGSRARIKQEFGEERGDVMIDKLKSL